MLKALTGRSRPHDGQGAHDFNGLGGGESFPSGHTAEAFTVAASIAENYHRPWISALSYSVAGLVGYARMEHDDHWLSDVTAGAFIGVGVAKQVSKLNRSRRGIAFMPLEEQGVRGIRISVSVLSRASKLPEHAEVDGERQPVPRLDCELGRRTDRRVCLLVA